MYETVQQFHLFFPCLTLSV